MSANITIQPGDWARVHHNPDCPGYRGHPHHPAEDGTRVQVSVVDADGQDHPIVGLYQGAPWATVMPPEGGLGIGRRFEPDELEVLPDDAIDASPEEQRERVRHLAP